MPGSAEKQARPSQKNRKRRAREEEEARQAALRYHPEVPALITERIWYLVAIEREPPGVRGPRPRKRGVACDAALSLQLPSFYGQPRYTFPPADIVRHHQTTATEPLTREPSLSQDPAIAKTPRGLATVSIIRLHLPLVLSVPPSQRLPSPPKIFGSHSPSFSELPCTPILEIPGPSSAPVES